MICFNREHHPLPHPPNPYCIPKPGLDPAAALNAVIAAALSYQASVLHDHDHPDNPHGDAELEYLQAYLDEAIRGYLAAGGTSDLARVCQTWREGSVEARATVERALPDLADALDDLTGGK